ncbi:hypothetical protein E3O47_00330 [Cryobacterium sp. TMT2-17-1]|uniref:hypothetical protein n=1 Tax=Cryobacterium sp. TMT2-17-1 TaxID=1259248 RepID=UPI00106B9E96|nr:hypothetical protein [Cryobacterium sp. TMT2-17-1]TFC55360.1 hypothetical protein E3O47_00330 [Cryobacterium sp. TMT2-17-1]
MPTTTPRTPVPAALIPDAPTPATTPSPLGEAPAVPESGADSSPDVEPGNRRRDPAAEAANRRHQLRDVEAQRDTLAGQLTTARRGMVENLLQNTRDLRGDGTHAPVLQRSADLWEVLGATPDQFFDEGGALDAHAVADAIAAGTVDRPYLTRYAGPVIPPTDPVRDVFGGPPRFAPIGASSWGNALK